MEKRETGRQRHGDRERQSQTDRQKSKERKTKIGRETDRQRDRWIDRQRDRHREALKLFFPDPAELTNEVLDVRGLVGQVKGLAGVDLRDGHGGEPIPIVHWAPRVRKRSEHLQPASSCTQLNESIEWMALLLNTC